MKYTQVDFLSSPARFQEKEGLYLEVRRREGRVLSDEMVKTLPEMAQFYHHHLVSEAENWARKI